ncbi:venom allergen 5-like [Venturia canescens]|uniref:venom allergen 5-like n=1 Tax=Venturia canescens TaxID=32260 RepID=UPI001C9D3CD5|nr:venom allergen 5-like [Venturia canescens]
MANILVVIAFVATLALSVMGQKREFCSIKTCRPNTHTLCLYPFLKPSQQCGTVYSSGLNQKEINELINIHNYYRNYVASGRERRGNPGPQPAAKNMVPLRWSNELAGIAQTWADQCKFAHDSCRNTGNTQIGQNIVITSTTGKLTSSLSDLVSSWYNEVSQFNKNEVKKYVFSRNTGHYSQLVWAKTTHLGCGAIRYNPDGRYNTLYLVCNYGPSGNWQGQPVYETR